VFGKMLEVEGKWKPDVQETPAENPVAEKPRLMN